MRVSLRLATLSDIPFLWYLRERPYVRKVSRNKKPISWSQHVQWAVPVVLGLAAKQLYVIEANGIAAGQLRFDFPHIVELFEKHPELAEINKMHNEYDSNWQ